MSGEKSKFEWAPLILVGSTHFEWAPATLSERPLNLSKRISESENVKILLCFLLLLKHSKNLLPFQKITENQLENARINKQARQKAATKV